MFHSKYQTLTVGALRKRKTTRCHLRT